MSVKRIDTFSASKCDHPPVPLGGTFERLDGTGNSTVLVRISCHVGLYLIGDDLLRCNPVDVNGQGGVERPVCASDVAVNKPAFQSSSTSSASKPVHPKNVLVTKHSGSTGIS